MKFRFGAVSMVLLFNIICFGLLYFYPGADTRELIMAVGIICALILGTYIIVYAFNLGDPYPFLTVAMLSSMSIIMLYSVGIKQMAEIENPSVPLMPIAKAQLKWFICGIGVFFASYAIYRLIKGWEKFTYFYMGMALMLYLISLIGPLKSPVQGVHNWVKLGPVKLQVSEFIKLCYCFAMASLFCRKTKLTGFKEKLYGIAREDVVSTVFVYMCLGFFILQRELGTALLFFFVYLALMMLYDVPFVMPLGNIAAVALGVLLLYSMGKIDYVMSRVEIWRDPGIDPAGAGYQITKSLEAICSGGYFGTGLGLSPAYTFPVIESDMIFSAICYEMGIFMGFAIIMIYFILSYRGFKIAIEVSEPFDKALALTMIISIAGQAFIIIGGVTKMIPLTGITMPFVSAGGSSMIVCFAMLGILTAISHKKDKSKLQVDKM